MAPYFVAEKKLHKFFFLDNFFVSIDLFKAYLKISNPQKQYNHLIMHIHTFINCS
jgi:hypothetical protein